MELVHGVCQLLPRVQSDRMHVYGGEKKQCSVYHHNVTWSCGRFGHGSEADCAVPRAAGHAEEEGQKNTNWYVRNERFSSTLENCFKVLK